jgi:MraZ protein
MTSPSPKQFKNFLLGSPKLFLGKHFRRLDKDYRFLIPDGFKKFLTDEAYITQGFDQNLWILSNSAFQEILIKLRLLNIADPLARTLFRLILGTATITGLNKQGYIEIPDDLRKYALIENEVLLIGQGDYFEIWSPELWDRQEAELKEVGTNADRFSTFEITIR